MNTDDLIKLQLELEDESMGLGIDRYRIQTQKAIARGDGSSTAPLQAMMNRIIEPTSKAISGWVQSIEELKHPGRAVWLKNFVAGWDPDQLAFIISKLVLNGVSRGVYMTNLAMELTAVLEDELSYTMLKEQAPGLYRKVHRQTSRSSSYRHRRAVMQVAATRCGYSWQKPLTDEQRLKVGILLVTLFREATGLIQEVLVPAGKNKKRKQIMPTEQFKQWIDDQHSRFEVMVPLLRPMVCKPDPWTTPFNGGFLNKGFRHSKLIKTDNRAYLEELATRDLTPVYRAVNALQDTAWRVNKGVLMVMAEVWDRGGNLGKLPYRDDEELPQVPHDIDTNEQAKKEWKQAASKVHVRNNTSRSKRVATAQKLAIAEKFQEYDAIYFPWQLDWRGRAYPMTSGGMHPQGDDSGKALLQFSEGKPLGENGAWWLAVHIANLFGVDKVAFEERVQFVLDHEEEILDSAARPLDGLRFWTAADKPYCALAACFEWAGYVMSGRSDAYVSHLPVAMDGSNNGLQNLSALLLDEVGGAAVNLVPADKPADIYMDVAKVVEGKVTRAALEGEPLAKCWEGKITRGLVKRPCMTQAYGSTKVGMRDQLIDYLRKCLEDRQIDALPIDLNGEPILDHFFHCKWLSEVIYDSIGEVVVAAREVMDWLQAVATVVSADGLPLYWTTPMGLPILQRYTRSQSKIVQFKMGTERFQLTVRKDTKKICKRSMANGVSPNLIHSIDAAHLQKTIGYCLDAGIQSFAMIHDSFGTHAGDCDEMFYQLRRAFVSIYSEDVLGDFLKEIIEQTPPELLGDIPPMPPKGTLDLQGVMDSQYFFA